MSSTRGCSQPPATAKYAVMSCACSWSPSMRQMAVALVGNMRLE